MPDGSNLIIGQGNTGTSTTSLIRSGGQPTTIAFEVENDGAPAISADSVGIAVVASSEGDDAIIGSSRRGSGVAGSSDESAGVFGTTGQGPGVVGIGTFGVFGLTRGNDVIGVFGLASGDSPGVWGQTSSGPWPGVEGFNTGSGNGVRGVSIGTAPGFSANNGVVGFSRFGSGVVGIANSPSNTAFGGVFSGGRKVSGGQTPGRLASAVLFSGKPGELV